MRGGQVVVAGLVAVVVLAAGAMIVIVTGSELESAGATECPEGSTMGSLDEAGQGRACTVVNTDRREVTFGVTVRNPTRFPLTVVDIPLQPLDSVGFTPERVVEGSPPFRLGGGEEHEVRIAGLLPSCEDRDSGGATTITNLAFRVRTLGVSESARVSLDPAVRLVSEPC